MPLDEPTYGQIIAAVPQIKPILPESRRFCESSIAKPGVNVGFARSKRERRRTIRRVARMNRIDAAIFDRALVAPAALLDRCEKTTPTGRKTKPEPWRTS
jgi:hypothetical protein